MAEKHLSSNLFVYFHQRLGSMSALPAGLATLNKGIRGPEMFVAKIPGEMPGDTPGEMK